MSTQIAIGFSQTPLISEAITQACISARNQLNNKNIDLVIVFATTSHVHPDMLGAIHAILKPSKLIGCSTAGILLSEGIFNRGIAVLAINSTDISFGITSTSTHDADDPRQAGVSWAHRLIGDSVQHPSACLLFAHHLNRINPSFMLGVQEVLGSRLSIAGGLASDDFKFKQTSIFMQKQIQNEGLAGLVINSNKVAISNQHGFKPLGKPRTITRAENNVILSIDNQPAINIYKEYLGKEAETLTQNSFGLHSILYPLGIYLETSRKYLIKNAVDITMEGSIVVTGDVLQGAEVHLMIGNKDSCRDSTIAAATKIKEKLNGRQAKLILIIESAGRQRILKSHASSEILIIKEILGYTTPIIGMYSFAEITSLSPENSINTIELQNGSITIITID